MRSREEIESEVRARLGPMPAYLLLAAGAPAMLDALWRQTCVAYLDSPLPPQLKERLIVHLSRCCNVAYCTVIHSCALRAAGAGADTILALLAYPDAGEPDALAQCRQVLAGAHALPEEGPAPGSALERALLTAALIQLRDRGDPEIARAVTRLLGPERHAWWLALLGYIATYHRWVTGQPELPAYDPAYIEARWPGLLRGLLDEQPALVALLQGMGAVAEEEEEEAGPAAAVFMPVSMPASRPPVGDYTASESLQHLLDSAPVGCIQVDTRGVIRFVNAQVVALFGYGRDELIGQAIEVLLPERFHRDHPGLRDAFFGHPAVRKMGAERRVYGRRKDGTEIPLEIGLAPSEIGTLPGAIATVVDISERELAIETLRRVSDATERLNRLFLAGAPRNSMYADVLDLILELFDSEIGFFGYIDEQGSLVCPSLTRHVWERCHVADKALVFPERVWSGIWGRVLREKQCLIKNEPHEVPAGHLPLHRSIGAPLLYRGEVIGALHLANRAWDYDEVDRKVMVAIADQIAPLLAAYRAEEELRRSNLELERFAYVASHDLQEPLRMVASYTELLSRRYKGHIDARADKYIEYAVDGVARMQKLINDILLLGRAGEETLSAEQVDCGSVLGEVLQDLELSIRQSGATITHDPLPVLSIAVSQLAQVLRNLVGNALKFRGDAPPRIHISAQRDGSHWTFRVADNGIGIEAEHSAKVFEMFQRLHARGKYEGSGIGLALAKKIVERHGGQIWFESTLGQGTTFYFTMPAEMA